MWVIPTLNRPAQCAAVLKQMDDMNALSSCIVFVNGEHASYQALLPEIEEVFYSRENLGALGALNWVLKEFPNEPWYGFIGDDEFVTTPWFEGKLLTSAGNWGIAHGDDGIHEGTRAQGYLVIGGDLARAVGYLALPECWHWYGLDTMWETLAANGACKRAFVPDVKVEHRHPYFNKGVMDECYRLGESRKDIDYQIYCHWLRYEMKNVVARVKKAKGE